jgi:hypothetical protein
MQPAELLRTPTSAIRGFSNGYASRQADLSDFSPFPQATNLSTCLHRQSSSHWESIALVPWIVKEVTESSLRKLSIKFGQIIGQFEDRSVYKPIEKFIATTKSRTIPSTHPSKSWGQMAGVSRF